MQNDEYFKKLRKKAKNQNKPLTEDAPVVQNVQQTGVYSFKTFAALRPIAGWILLIIVLMFMGFMMYYVGKDYGKPEEAYMYDYSFYGTITLASLIALMIFIDYIMYRGWIEKLSYRLTGWGELMSKHRFGNTRHYRYIKIILHPKPNSTEHHSVMMDAMKILYNRVDKINSVKTEHGIEKWMMMNGFMFEGPVNIRGMKRLRKSLRNELNEVNKRLNSIDRLEIFVSAREFEHGYKYNRWDNRVAGIDY